MKKYTAPSPAPESTHLSDLAGAVLSVVKEQCATQDKLTHALGALAEQPNKAVQNQVSIEDKLTQLLNVLATQPGKVVRVEILRDKWTKEMTELIITRE